LADLFHLPLGDGLISVLGLGEVFDKRPSVSRYVSLLLLQPQTSSRLILVGGGVTSRLGRVGLL
jgi:hypothetical protein